MFLRTNIFSLDPGARKKKVPKLGVPCRRPTLDYSRFLGGVLPDFWWAQFRDGRTNPKK
jgi:hypothetical protein